MAICILNSAAMSPWFPHWQVGTSCLCVESEQGLVLVDTGLGLDDYRSPSRMVRFFSHILRIAPEQERAAVSQLALLGYRPEHVQHIVLTHLPFDHAGGLPDFPHAQIHIYRREYDVMMHRQGLLSLGYDLTDFAHDPQWVFYEDTTTNWYGFDAVRLPFVPEIYLIPLCGHTLGHCGIALQDGNGWLFQCADALPTHAQFDLTPDWLNLAFLGPHGPRLRAFAAEHPEVRMLAGHMWASFFAGGE